MKHPRVVLSILLLSVALVSTARAALVETKVRTIMREKPMVASRVVARVAAFKKLRMLGMSGDGNWVHVRARGHEGWLATAAMKEFLHSGVAFLIEQDVRLLSRPGIQH